MTELSNNLSQTTNKVKSFLSRMLSATDWQKLWDNPDLEVIVKDLQKSGLTPETCQKAKLVPISYWLGNSTLEEPTKRAFLKELLGLSSTIINGQDLLSVELLGFPYFTAEGELAFVRVRCYPALTLQEKDGSKLREAKYLQPVGTPARPYILPEVWEIASKPHKPMWITEGEKKALALLQHGEYAVALSGVWNFRAGDSTQGATDGDKWLWEELRAFNWTGRVVNLAFDMDLWTNPQVRMALFELALKLYSLGAVVRVAQWDKRYKGVDDFLAEHPLEKVKDKSWLELVMPEDLDPIVRAFALVVDRWERAKTEQLLKQLSNRLKVSERTLWHTIHTEREQNQNQEQEQVPQELVEEAMAILKGDFKERLLQDLEQLYAGRQKEKLLLYLVSQSRKVQNLPLNLAVILRGSSSVGKSSLVRTVLGLSHQDDILEISYQSRAYLNYGVKSLDGKVLFLTEFEGSSKGLYNIKLALTEQVLHIRSIEATKDGLKPINRTISCKPMALVGTGVAPVLDEELSTRAIVLSLTFDEALAGKALEVKSLISAEQKAKIKSLWLVVDRLIQPARVLIPFLPRLVEVMKNRLWAERVLRDWDKFVGLVMTSALIHQHQRQKAEDGSVIATVEDYMLAYELQDLFSETFGGLPQDVSIVVQTLKELEGKQKENEDGGEVLKADLIRAGMEKTGKSERTVRGWVERAVRLGYVGTYGRGRAGAKVYLKIEEIPQPELPFPHPQEVFTAELPNCLINSKALRDNDINKATDFCPILPNCLISSEDHTGINNEEMGQNEANDPCLILSVEPQGFERNKAIGQETSIGSATMPEEKQAGVGAYLTALDWEFKKLKKSQGEKARSMTFYYNQSQNVWELINGVRVVAKIPVANGLSVQQAVEMLRTAWQNEFSSWEEADEIPF